MRLVARGLLLGLAAMAKRCGVGQRRACGLAGAAAAKCRGPPESPSAGGAFACRSADAEAWASSPPNGSYACGFCEGHEATAHLLEVAATLERLKARECRRLVVYGVAFGAKYLRRWPNRTLLGARTVRDLHSAHGRCFFKFMLESDVPAIARRGPARPSFFVRHNHKVEDLALLVALDGDRLCVSRRPVPVRRCTASLGPGASPRARGAT